jgi:hypothetical protein
LRNERRAALKLRCSASLDLGNEKSWTPMTDLTATRAEGERLLTAFAPGMGRRYANGRNTDHGPGRHVAVSVLSPYIRRRLVLEGDVVAAALAAHGPQDAEKNVAPKSGPAMSTGCTLIWRPWIRTAACARMWTAQRAARPALPVSMRGQRNW